MSCRAVWSNSGSEKTLKLVATIYQDDLAYSRDYMETVSSYAMYFLREFIKDEIDKHPEINTPPNKGVRIVFRYPKFNTKDMTALTYIADTPNQDMLEVAEKALEHFEKQMLTNFRNELEVASYRTFFDYVEKHGIQYYRNVVESALCQGEIKIYLRSSGVTQILGKRTHPEPLDCGENKIAKF